MSKQSPSDEPSGEKNVDRYTREAGSEVAKSRNESADDESALRWQEERSVPSLAAVRYGPARSDQLWLMTWALVAIAVVVLAIAMAYMRAVMIPFVLAVFIASLISPLIDYLVLKWRLSRTLATFCGFLVVLAFCTVVGMVVVTALQTAILNSAKYSDQLAALGNRTLETVERWRDTIIAPPDDAADSLADDPTAEQPQVAVPDISVGDGFALQQASDTDTENPDAGEAADDISVDDVAVDLRPELSGINPDVIDGDQLSVTSDGQVAVPPPPSGKPNFKRAESDDPVRLILLQIRAEMPRYAAQTAGTMLSLMSTGFLAAIFAVFLMAARDPHAARAGIYKEIDQQIRTYLATKLAISVATGLLVWLSLRWIGLPMAFVFGTLALLLNFIPSIGSVIATLAPIPIAVAVFDDWTRVFLVVAIPGAIQMVIGNVLDPKLTGDGLQLHPVTVLFSLAIWGLLWGPIGMLLAVPITGIIRIVLKQFPITRGIARLLAGELPGDIHTAAS